ncbi:mini spindles [Carabus blaptoides fortunei]
MYVEIEKQEAVQEELLKGMDSKNPKIVAACVSAVTLALHEFGSKVVNVKPLIKKMPTLLADRDKTVRDECKAMVIEIYRWIGGALRSQLANLQPVQVTELEAEFDKVGNEKVSPSRYLRSQQQKQAKLIAESGGMEEGDEQYETDAAPEIDPYDLVDPVNILSKLPSDFYEKVEAKKWQERKEAVEAVENLVKAPKLENGDYGDLVRALKKIISKDSNVMVVALAGKCLAGLAGGLKKRFQPYAGACVPALLEKFKEKKQNVVIALREALDAIFISTTVEAIVEDVLEALNNKNPAVKAETAAFLSRAFARCQPTALNKKMLKAYTGALLKTLNEPDPTVRDNSAEALGTLMKLVGEKAIAPFVVEMDNIKKTKIKECYDKAVILTKVEAPKRERPATAPAKTETASAKAGSTAPKPVKKPASAAPVAKRKSVPTVAASKGKAKASKPVEQAMSPEEIDDKASDLFDSETLNSLADSNWKGRLAAVEKYQETVKQLPAGSISAQVLVGILSKKPGLKDTNIQVLKSKLETLKMIADTHKCSTISIDMCINDVIDKLGDAKNGGIAAEVLTTFAEVTKLEHVANAVLDYAFNQKSPKVQQESLLWVSTAIKEFGFQVNAKSVIEVSKKGVAATNPSVRTATISLLGVLYLYMGSSLHMFFENEKPVLRQQINAEFDKYDNMKPPDPIRGLSKSKSASADNLDEMEDGGEKDSEPAFNPQDLFPRIDISNQITEALINELSDKNWKVRNEALTKVQAILNEAKLIHPNIGDLPQALAHRLVDSNGKIAQTAIQICQTLATAMGPQCKQHVRLLFPGILQGFGDSKNWIRAAAVTCINTWGDLCGYKEFFDGEMIGDALKAGSPTLRTELWAWLGDKLNKVAVKSIPKEELMVCIPLLFTNVEDRNADVRKNAQEAVLSFMIHLGYESMCKQTEKLKPGSKTAVMAALDKARPNLPIKPLPKNKQQAPVEPPKAGKAAKPGSATKPVGKVRGSVAGGKTATARKKDDDIDTSPLLVVNNLKHQRVIDEQKLRVLKWNFVQPREEFVELLKDQMSAANVNRSLMANMFHADFRYHLKAIESLTEDLADNSPALILNLDLILKWLTLRFFDTNPSVLLKGLEYLQVVFSMLVENGHTLLEHEASSFIPYLILKVGDPKDAVRNGVRALFKQIAMVYPVSKLFSNIMEGVKSKNARQRTECLEELGSLIEGYGISVCQPSPQAALKEVAKQISDRDNSVRNAALNCVVQAYFIEGERVYKMVGQISDKDFSLLEERIKRASKKGGPPKQARATINPQQMAQPTVVTQAPALSREPSDIEPKSDEETQDITPPVLVKQPTPPRPVSGPFGLDPNLLKQIEGAPVRVMKPQLIEMDLNFLDETAPSPAEKPSIMPINPPKRILPNQSFATRPSISNMISNPRVGQELIIEKTINQIGSPDLRLSNNAILQMDDMLHSGKANQITEFEDQFMIAITLQLKLLHSQNPRDNSDILKTYRALLTVLSTFYDNKILGRRVSRDVLKDILYQLITLLVDTKLESFESSDAYNRVINLQCVRIIEKSDHTNIICALIKLLYDCVSSTCSPRFLDLVMKCLWRVIKIIPTWADEMDYDTILYEIHLFFKDFPSTWWKQKASDTPIRTIKTIVHSMAKIKGNGLMSHLSKISNPNESELQAYLLKLLKTLKLEEVKQIPLKKDLRRPLSRLTHNMLSEIFQKIGSKEATKEGLTQLYDFKVQYPEADIEPYLERSSQFFQEYIEKGLKDIEASRKKTATEAALASSHMPATENDEPIRNTNQASDSKENPNYWMDRLRMWQTKTNTPTSGNSLDNKIQDENLNSHKSPTTTAIDLNTSKDHDFQKALHSAEESTRKVEAIRRRIEMMKATSTDNTGNM